MKTTLGEVFTAKEALAEVGSLKLPYEVGYELSIIIENAEKACTYFVKQINEIDRTAQDAQEKINELCATKIEMQGKQISRADFDRHLNETNQAISAHSLRAIDFIFDQHLIDTDGFTILEV